MLKNAPLLRNLTELKPVVDNNTRWSGKLHMVCRFSKIRDKPVAVKVMQDSDITVDCSLWIAGKVRKFELVLNEIYIVIDSLQTRG